MEYELIQKAAEIIKNSRYAIASTGAGVSAESGIATFRDVGGIWDKIDVSSVATPEAFIKTIEKNAAELIPFCIEILESFIRAEVNPGHTVLAKLEEMNILKQVITQNGDSLHYEAGNRNIIELHGNFFRMRCFSCRFIKQESRQRVSKNFLERIKKLKDYSIQSLISTAENCPRCSSIMRPDVVMFSETVQNVDKAFSCAEKCDVMLVLGTSGSVYPASYLPIQAKKNGAKIIVINPTEDTFENYSDIFIPMKTGESLPLILENI